MQYMKLRVIKPSSANIQAEFYHRCRLAGINCILEHKYDDCRFDILCYDRANNVFAIIEAKYAKDGYVINKFSRQWRKYNRYGIPLFYIANDNDINTVFNDIVRLNKNTPEYNASLKPAPGTDPNAGRRVSKKVNGVRVPR